jgi:hypothetical protein
MTDEFFNHLFITDFRYGIVMRAKMKLVEFYALHFNGFLQFKNRFDIKMALKTVKRVFVVKIPLETKKKIISAF